MAKKTKGFRASAKLDDDLGESFERVKKLTGYNDTQIIEECLKAYCDHVLKYGSVIHPIEIFPSKISEHKEYIQAIEETQAEYKSRRKLKREVIKANSGLTKHPVINPKA